MYISADLVIINNYFIETVGEGDTRSLVNSNNNKINKNKQEMPFS